MKKILIIIAIFMCIFISQKEKHIIIPSSAIRFRIIANSNSLEDQTIKNTLEKKVESYLYSIVKDANNSKQAKEKIINHYEELNNLVKKHMESSKKGSAYDISIGNNYFPVKKYKGVKYDAGYYDSVVIKLGHHQGLNWWCVIYPPLCLIDSKEKENTKVEYTTLVSEMLEKYNM